MSKYSVRKPYTVVVAVIMVLILGGISFVNLKTDLLPSIDLPFVLIMTNYPGASPEEVEMVVTRPIEQGVATTSNIKEVSSVSSENSSMVMLEFNNDVNMDSATIEINGMLDMIKPLWNDSIGAPMVLRLNPDMLPIMVSAVDVEGMDVIEISEMVREEIIPELESVSGVASVSGMGLLEEKVEVLIDGDKIDVLNKKILEKVDSELSEAEDKLMDAQKEIKEGKSKLESERKNQTAKLTQGEQAIVDGKKQISDALSQMSAGELELEKAQKELEANLLEVKQEEEELKSLEGLLSGLQKNLPQMDEEEVRRTFLAIINGLPKDMKDRIEPQLEELGNAGELLAALSKELEDNLELISKGKLQMEAGLKEIGHQRTELIEQKALLSSQKDELTTKQQELMTGKLVLNMEMDRAKSELESGEATLEEKLDEFETAKEEALKGASLEGAITTEMVSGILAAQNFSMPAGYVSHEGTDYLVKVGDKIKDIDEMENLLLFDTGDEGIGKIFLKDVAQVSLEDNSKDIYAKVNGNDAVMLTFQKQSNFSTAEVADGIRKKAEALVQEHEGLSITSLMDQGIYIDIVVDSVLKNVLYGGLLAIIILLLFLKDLRPTFIIAVSIPISLIFAIAMMYFTGVTINIISLAGLALGVGMLVDNSIVVIENIYRMRQEGKSAIEAAIDGSKKVAGAIIASTLTTACVFLPVVFIKGISRQLFMDMGLTIAYSLFASLIVALTLVPAMASNMLKNTKDTEDGIFKKITDVYGRMLEWTLGHKSFVMIFVVGLLVFSIFLASSMGTAFIPDMEAPQMSISIEMSKEATFEDITDMSDKVIERMLEVDDIEAVGAFQGGMMGGIGGIGGGSNSNSMSLYLILDENKSMSNQEIENQIYALTDDLDCKVQVSTSNMDISALGGSGIEVLIKGREIDVLRDISLDMAKILEETEGTFEISDGLGENVTEMRIVVNKQKSMEKGLTVAQVFSKVNALIAKGKSATILSGDNKDYPVIVLDKQSQSIARDDLENLILNGKKGEGEDDILLGDIAEIKEEKGLTSIRRNSQEKFISVTAGIDADHNIGIVSRGLETKLKDYEVPHGYRIELSGENETINNSLRDLIYMLLLAIAFIYLIMVAQFQSLLSPFIVMFTIPLAFTGGLIALAITGYEISLISMLGFLVLSGIVVNNGIVFVDFTNQLRDTGLDKAEALLVAGKTRLKPILMTALTTILGLSTLSLGVGMGAEMLQPLAIVAIGGLTYSTILTLLVIPVMYDLLHKKSKDKILVGEEE
ncbi:MAG TPA: efflux RND transporter permease subunit [Clostridia bacterium]|nr:efflux RND transporter permease subunit [Clostridia bacterium]